MSSLYQLHELFRAVNELSQVELTVCTRDAEWNAVKAEYPTLSANIEIIHKTGAEMEAELQAADIAILFVKP